jgi:phytol kinase
MLFILSKAAIVYITSIKCWALQVSLFDLGLAVLVFVVVILLIGAVEFLRRKLNLGAYTTRRAIHLFAGDSILFVPFFSNVIYPLLLPIGMGVITALSFTLRKGSFLTQSMIDEKRYSRLHAYGPVFYIISIGILLITLWSQRPIIMAATMVMAWGDGAASAITPSLKKRHLYPFSDKSYEGSTMMFIFAFLGALAAYSLALFTGIMSSSLTSILMLCALGALVGTVAEALTVGPIRAFDNFTVPFACALSLFLATPLII